MTGLVSRETGVGHAAVLRPRRERIFVGGGSAAIRTLASSGRDGLWDLGPTVRSTPSREGSEYLSLVTRRTHEVGDDPHASMPGVTAGLHD